MYAKLISYGAIGLGCALAIIAANLLRQELKTVTDRRPGNFVPIYVFMAFSFALAILGFGAETFRFERSAEQTEDQLKSAQLALGNAQGALASAQNLAQQDREHLNLVTKTLKPLIATKIGMLDQLRQMQPTDPSYSSLVEQMRRNLTDLDNRTQAILDDSGKREERSSPQASTIGT